MLHSKTCDAFSTSKTTQKNTQLGVWLDDICVVTENR